MRCRPPRTRSRASSRPARSSCACAPASPTSSSRRRRPTSRSSRRPHAPRCRRRPTRARRRASTSACPSSSRPASSGPRPRAAVRQRLARPRRRRRARARRPSSRPARRPHRPGLHRLGAMTPRPSTSETEHMPPNLTSRRTTPCRPSTPPNPISATIDLALGDVRITAGDRDTTDVEMRPDRPLQRGGPQGRRADARRVRGRAAAGQAAEAALLAPGQHRRVDRRDGRAPGRLARERHARGWGTSTATVGSATPGSRPASVASGRLRRDAQLRAGTGDITVDRATGDAEITTGSGDVRLGAVDGGAVIKNSNGDSWVGVASDDVRLRAANGASPSTWRRPASAPSRQTATSDSARSCADRSSSRPSRRPRGRHP